MAAYKSAYRDDSDADDEFERGDFTSPTIPDEYDDTIESDDQSPDHTPTTTFTHSQGQISPQGLITEWSADQVADFVSSLGLEQYANAFLDEGISGEVLIELQHPDLKEMGVESLGHRLIILKSIYEVKVKQNVPLDPDHFIPLSADAGGQVPTQDDISRIIRIIKDRDEQIHTMESEFRTLKDDLNRVNEEYRRLREEFLPLARLAKQQLPLPTPDGDKLLGQGEKSTGGLSRKFSTKRLFLGSAPKNPSPTIPEGRALTDSSSLDPSAAAMTASSHLAASMRDGNQPATSPHAIPQPSPTSPAYSVGQPTRAFPRDNSRMNDDYPHHWSGSTMTPDSRSTTSKRTDPSQLDPPGSGNSINSQSATSGMPVPTPQSSSSNPQVEIFKSFRVSIDDPCHKVLPVALKKYNITADWRQYALYIVHGDQERCLGLNEKPLILFKQLDREGRKPMFMLRKHAQPMEGHVNQLGGGPGRESVGGWGGGGGVQIPGGVL